MRASFQKISPCLLLFLQFIEMKSKRVRANLFCLHFPLCLMKKILGLKVMWISLQQHSDISTILFAENAKKLFQIRCFWKCHYYSSQSASAYCRTGRSFPRFQPFNGSRNGRHNGKFCGSSFGKKTEKKLVFLCRIFVGSHALQMQQSGCSAASVMSWQIFVQKYRLWTWSPRFFSCSTVGFGVSALLMK